jgi:dolichol-phosphate mannosyltransferase
MKETISIIVPVFNEAEGIARAVTSLTTFIDTSPQFSTIIFVNDGSTDSSQQLLSKFCVKDQRLRLIDLKKNYGLSTALKAGFDAATTPWVAYIDADLQTDPKDLLRFVEHMDDHDLITGIRAKRQDSFIKKKSSQFANWFRQLFTNDGVKDTGCPLKLIRRSYTNSLLFFDGMHRFIPALVQLQGGRVQQIEVGHYPRISGSSKFNMWNRSIRPLTDCFVFLWMRRRWIRYSEDGH